MIFSGQGIVSRVNKLNPDNGIDLTLVGHTHGGQIDVPFISVFISNVSKGYEQYISGLYEVDNVLLYVNRGLGENNIHMRFLSRPEISLLTLHRKSDSVVSEPYSN